MKKLMRTLLLLCLVGAWWACDAQPPKSEAPASEPTSRQEPSTSDGAPELRPTEPSSTEPSAAPEPRPTEPAPTEPTTEPKKTTTHWYKHVLPIFQKHCLSCHRGGGIGPFKLEKYADARSKAALIKWAVETKRMPPWMPDDTGVALHGVRSMSGEEIQTVLRWIAEGTPAGDPADAPKAPPKTDQLEWVDKTVAPAKAYSPSKQSGRDDYHCLVIDPKLTQERDLIGYEVVPGVKAIVHHVLIYPVELAKALAKEKAPGEGYTCYGGPDVAAPKGVIRMIGGWVPGTTTTVFPKGTGMRLPAGVGIVMQIHYNFDQAQSQPDLTKIRLQFARQPVASQLNIAGISSRNGTGLKIPPGAKMHQESGSIDGGPARLWGVLPHMHALGRKIRIELEKPDGTTSTLIQIPRWDFNWQQLYFFKQSLVTQKGAKLRIRCWYDNPGKDPVTWGESTTDEMCLNYVYYTTK